MKKKKTTSTATYAIVGVVALGAAWYAWQRWGHIVTGKAGTGQTMDNNTGGTVQPPPLSAPLSAADLGYRSGAASGPTTTLVNTGFKRFGDDPNLSRTA